MALETDLSAVNTISSDINPINEVVETPATPPIDLPNTVVIAQGFIAGAIDGSTPGFGGMVGSGLISPGFFSVNEDHNLTFFLASQGFDYSSSAYPEIGNIETGEFRLGDDVSVDSSGAINGSHYLRYAPSAGLEIVGGNLTISSGNYAWVGTDIDNGIGLAADVVVGSSVISGLVATHNEKVKVFINAANANFFLGPDYANQAATDAIINYDGSNLILQNTNLNITTGGSGYVWLGNSNLSQGVGLTTGISGFDTGFYAVNGSTITFSLSAEDGSFATGSDVTLSGLTGITSSYIVFSPSTGLISIQNSDINLYDGNTHTINIGHTGTFAVGDDVSTLGLASSTTKYIHFNGSTLALQNVNVQINSAGYFWVGQSDFSGGVGLAYNVAGVSGLVATDGSSNVTARINSTDGTFKFGTSSKYVEYDGTDLKIVGSNLTLSSGNYVWVGTPITDGVGFCDSGLYAATGGVQTVLIDQSDGSFTFGKSGGNQLSYSSSTGTITLNGATINDWADISGSNIPAQNATVGATAGTNMYSSGGSTIPEAEVLNYTQGRGAYNGVSFPDITGKPMAINAYITTEGTGGWYKVASVTFGGQYGAFSFHGLFSKGESGGRVTTQSRVKLGCTSDASNNVSSPFYRYSGDNPTTYLKLRYSGTTVTLYCWLNTHDSVVLQGNWTCCPKSGGSSWFDNYQTDLDTIGSSDPGGTNVTATANYEIGADITGDHTANDVEYGSGKAVYQYHADRTSLNTANNTDHVNGAITSSGHIYSVFGDLRIMNGKDIEFYSGNGTGYVGGISADTKGIYIHGSSNNVYIDGEDITLYPNSGYNIYLRGDSICYGAIRPQTTTSSETLGISSKHWFELYVDRLGDAANYIQTSYLTAAYISTAYVTTLSVNTSTTLPVNLTVGSNTHDSSHNFKLHIWDGTKYVDYDAYISNW